MQVAGCYAEVTFRKAVEAGIAALIEAGTTVVGDVSATGASVGPLLESGLAGVVYIEVLGLYAEQADRCLNGVRYLIDEWRPKERNGMRLGLSIHAPYSTHPALWRKALDYARQEALPLCIHIAESSAEYEYLTQGTGPFADEYYPGLGMPAVTPPRTTPIRYLEDLGALDLKPLLVHAIHVDDDDIQRIKASGASVVHCPRSNLRLRCGRIPLEKYLAHGVPVYLGTDSLSSSPSLNIFDELEVAVALHHDRVQPEAIEALLRQPLPV
jgi:5-methylthioadenosine/S-adenosylhomocysteine deaminase